MVAAGTYRFGPDSGRLLVRTARTGLGSRAGHDLVIEVAGWQATARVATEPAASSVEMSARTDSFEVREGRGGIKPFTDADRAEIERTIREKILQPARHPVIEFVSTAVHGSADALVVAGRLTISGVTHPVTVRGRVDDSGERPRVSGSAVVTQSTWGIKPYSAFLGALKLRDDVDVEFEADLVATG